VRVGNGFDSHCTLHQSIYMTQKVGPYGCLNILEGRTGRQMGGSRERFGHRDDVRTVDQVIRILTKDRQLPHYSFEGRLHESLVYTRLPGASGARIYH
jgi:hypothetical protein